MVRVLRRIFVSVSEYFRDGGWSKPLQRKTIERRAIGAILRHLFRWSVETRLPHQSVTYRYLEARALLIGSGIINNRELRQQRWVVLQIVAKSVSVSAAAAKYVSPC